MYKVYIQNTTDLIDISSIVSNIEYYTDIEGQAGKFTFDIDKDPSNIIQCKYTGSTIDMGNKVVFYNDNTLLYKGYVFSTSINEKGKISVVSYDQLRYLSNKDTFITQDASASDIFREICNRARVTNYKIKTPSKSIIPSTVWNMKTYYDILDSVLTDTLVNEGIKYYVCDRAGVLTFDTIDNSDTNLIIGEKSLLTEYTYKSDIDSNTYNRVIVQTGSEEEGITKVEVQQDNANIVKWGLLQSIVNFSSDIVDSIASAYAKAFLDVYNKPSTTLKLNAIGDDRVYAGCMFTLYLPSMGKSRRVYANSVKHKYDCDIHTMEIEVATVIGDNYE